MWLCWFRGNWNSVGLRLARNWGNILWNESWHPATKVCSHDAKYEGCSVVIDEGRWAVEDRPPSVLAPVSVGALKPATRGRVQNQQVNGRSVVSVDESIPLQVVAAGRSRTRIRSAARRATSARWGGVWEVPEDAALLLGWWGGDRGGAEAVPVGGAAASTGFPGGAGADGSGSGVAGRASRRRRASRWSRLRFAFLRDSSRRFTRMCRGLLFAQLSVRSAVSDSAGRRSAIDAPSPRNCWPFVSVR